MKTRKVLTKSYTNDAVKIKEGGAAMVFRSVLNNKEDEKTR